MKALRTKVILSGIVLVFAFIATIGTTFAWFTVSDTVAVESMDINVTAADNLLITPFYGTASYVNDGSGSSSTTGTYDLGTTTNYQTSVSQADLIAAGYLETTGNPHRLAPVTSINVGYAADDPKTLSTINVLDRVLSGATANNNAGDYIQLKFWLYSQSENNQIIELSGLTINAGNIAADDGNTTPQDNVIQAVRLGVWLDDSTYGTAGAEGSGFIFGNDADYSYTFAGTIYDDDEAVVTGTGDTLAQVSTAQAGSAVTTATLYDNTSTIDLFTLQPETPTLVTVNIWIEGWDADAINDIASAVFNISFSFKFGTAD